MKGTKIKSIVSDVVCGALAIGLWLAFWAWGFFTRRAGESFTPAVIAVHSVLGALLVAGVLYQILLSARVKARIEKRAKKKPYSRSGVAVVALAYLYVLALVAVIMFAAFAVGRADAFDADSSYMTFAIPSVFLLWGLIKVLIGVSPSGGAAGDTNDDADGVEIPRDRFPLLCETVERGVRAAGCELPVRIFLAEGGLSVGLARGAVNVRLGYLRAAVYTQGELFAAAMHAAVVASGKPATKASVMVRLDARWNGEDSNPISSFSRLCLVGYFADSIGAWARASNIADGAVLAADEIVKERVDAREFCDMLAKTEMLDKYAVHAVPELDFYVYESETLTETLATLDYNTYNAYIGKYGEIWRADIDRELSVYPCARERMKKLGVTEYDIDRAEPDVMYVAERQRLLSAADRLLYGAYKDVYAATREVRYVERKADMELADKGVVGAKRNIALSALCSVDDERAMALADEMIESDDGWTEFAQYAKGLIYNRTRDARCVECFRAAAKEPSLVHEAYEYLAQYAYAVGNAELYDEAVNGHDKAVKEAEKTDNARAFGKNTVTVPCDLDDAFVDALAAKLDNAANGLIKTVYITEYIFNGEKHYSVAYDIKRSAARFTLDVFEAVCSVLRGYKGDPLFNCANPSARLMRKVKKAEGVMSRKLR